MNPVGDGESDTQRGSAQKRWRWSSERGGDAPSCWSRSNTPRASAVEQSVQRTDEHAGQNTSKREDVRYGKCVSGDSTEFLREDRQRCREDVVERDSQRPPASKSDVSKSQSVPKRSFKGGVRELRDAPEKSQLGKQPHALVKLQLRPPVRPRVLSESAVGAQEQRAVFVFVRRVTSDAED
jgi:hypothetical protein